MLWAAVGCSLVVNSNPFYVLSESFFLHYNPGQETCIDEAIVKYKGHIKGKVHMPIKMDFKIWCCCCSCCGYLCTFQVCEGKPMNLSTGK